MNGGWCISYEIALRWMQLDFTDNKSTLVQVMAWCRQATSHYLSQCWPRSMLPNGVTRPQWVNLECKQEYDELTLSIFQLLIKWPHNEHHIPWSTPHSWCQMEFLSCMSSAKSMWNTMHSLRLSVGGMVILVVNKCLCIHRVNKGNELIPCSNIK